MPRYLIALGSSDRFGIAYLNRAEQLLGESSAFLLVAKSRTFSNVAKQTGFNRLFYNSVVGLRSHHHPLVVYRELYAIEKRLGRIRPYPLSPRTIDIDILLSLDLTYRSRNFFLPHREAFNRNFFVVPAIEALRSCLWPIPLRLLRARSQLGCDHLKACD